MFELPVTVVITVSEIPLWLRRRWRSGKQLWRWGKLARPSSSTDRQRDFSLSGGWTESPDWDRARRKWNSSCGWCDLKYSQSVWCCCLLPVSWYKPTNIHKQRKYKHQISHYPPDLSGIRHSREFGNVWLVLNHLFFIWLQSSEQAVLYLMLVAFIALGWLLSSRAAEFCQ